MEKEMRKKAVRGLLLRNDRRGLSEIVATLIIILLVIIAIGIIWTVVRNLLQSGADQIEISTKCNNIDISAVSVSPTVRLGNYTVRFSRGSDAESPVDGIKITFYNNETNSPSVVDFGSTLSALQDKTQEVNSTLADQIGTSGVTFTSTETMYNATKITYTPYFLSSTGETQLCPGWTRTYEF